MSAAADLAADLPVSELVPGDLAALETMTAGCRVLADELAASYRGITYIQVHGRHWSGRAADVYEAARHDHLGSLWSASTAFETAAGALSTYTRTLRTARGEARSAKREYHAAVQAANACASPPALPVPSVAGAGPPVLTAPQTARAPGLPASKQAAISRLERARREVHEEGLRAMWLLEEAARTVPERGPTEHLPSLKDVLAGIVKDTVTAPYHLAHGAAAAAASVLTSLPHALSPRVPGAPAYGPDNSAALQPSLREAGGGLVGTAMLVSIVLDGAGLAARGAMTLPRLARLLAARDLLRGSVMRSGLALQRDVATLRAIRDAVPDGWVFRAARNGNGAVWQRSGALRNGDSIRVMQAKPGYPDGYVRFYNGHGQPLNLDGKPGSLADTHIPRRRDGSFPVPRGW